MEREILEYQNKPYIVVDNGKIVDFNGAFLMLSGFGQELIEDIIIEYMWDNMLKVSIRYKDIDVNKDCFECFVFCKGYEVKETEVHVIRFHDSDRRIYVFHARYNIMFSEKYPFLEQLNSVNGFGVALFCGKNHILLKANDNYLALLNESKYNREEIMGMEVQNLTTSWNNSQCRSVWETSLITGQAVHNCEHSRSQDTYWDCTLTPIMEEGLVKYMVVVIGNVTERVKYKQISAENSKLIQLQREQLTNILENVRDAIYIIDKEGHLIRLNNTANEGLIDNSITNREEIYQAIEFYNPDGSKIPFDDLPSSCLMRGEKVVNRLMYKKSVNGEKYVYSNGTPIMDEHGNFEMGILCNYDMTEQIKQQQALLAAKIRENKNLEEVIKLKDEFLYIISHEFKTPLTVIHSAVQALEYIYEDQIPQKAFQLIKKVKQNSYRQLRLVNNILDVTKINAGYMKMNESNIDIVFLTNSIIDSVQPYAHQKGIKLSISSTISQKIIGIDDEKYERVLLNILSNAIKFTPNGRSIEVRISTKKLKGEPMICIKIEDCGVGIPKEKQDFIFERFGQVDNSLTRQAEGTGIGLYLVKLLVQGMKGTIHLSSEIEKGSIFTIILPAHKAKNVSISKDISFLDDERLVRSTAIEFSDIYL